MWDINVKLYLKTNGIKTSNEMALLAYFLRFFWIKFKIHFFFLLISIKQKKTDSSNYRKTISLHIFEDLFYQKFKQHQPNEQAQMPFTIATLLTPLRSCKPNLLILFLSFKDI